MSLVSMPLFEMLHLLQVILYFRETLQERSAGTYLRHIVSGKEPWSGNINLSFYEPPFSYKRQERDYMEIEKARSLTQIEH